MSASGLDVEIELWWGAGERYCCAEWGCFVAPYNRAWWARLREALREVSEREPGPMSLRVHGVVDEGALLMAMEQVGLPVWSRAYGYVGETRHERDAK